MEDMDMNDEHVANEMSQRAVSLYGQNEGVDDFPVLKAFQQYIDAEQEKARKRILGLGIFFGAVLVIVITVFMILLHGINMRNQSLSDRLVEYAMKESDRRHSARTDESSVDARQNDAALKAMTDALAAIQRNIETSSKNAEKSRSEKALDDVAEQKESIRLQRMQNQLEAEKKLLAEERERLHQIEIERQRRKLYPELYEETAVRRNTPSRSRMLTDEDIREIIREAYPEASVREETKAAPAVKTEKTNRTEAEKSSEVEVEEDGDAVEYFKDDNYTIPVDVKGTDAKVRFTLPTVSVD